eukprot:CAMPEP_0182443060 /NCGR_PEP_ID=MMETSP1172-20130603/1902_1 /TAXON_ID=708627 /ORGANISM="Timspurckia oligopyrenoides, Strain CCMP3278" /LENGTH=731 /DNA_ID=CAMNT_0024638225 /DNA_START=114 /DNA_END=2309 /DNA_ORIENTATION=-
MSNVEGCGDGGRDGMVFREMSSVVNVDKQGEELRFEHLNFKIKQEHNGTRKSSLETQWKVKEWMRKPTHNESENHGEIDDEESKSSDEDSSDLESGIQIDSNTESSVIKSTQYKMALSDVCGYAKPGEVLAVMGPSGGGKSTLLHALTGRGYYGESSGTILFNGQHRDKMTRRKVGYVMQDDVFFSNLTVRETLWFTSRIRVSDEVSKDEKLRRMNDVIRRLGLSHCEHTQIGNQSARERISGGERKRVNIANELLTNPSILILDEPTSGLDSNTALTVVRLLKEIASEGKTIVTTIHQPSSQMFAEFDKLLLLAEGHVVYFGEAAKAVEYFASIGFECPYGYNPSDYFLQLLTEEDLNGGVPIKSRLKEEWKKRQDVLFPRNHESDGVNRQKSLKDKVLEKSDQILKKLSNAKSSSQNVLDENNGKSHKLSALFHDSKYPVSWWRQFVVLSERAFRQKRGDHFKWIPFSQYFVVTMLVSIVWFQMNDLESSINDRIGLLFFAGVFWGFSSMFSALFTLPSERGVIAKDRASGSYAMSAYYLAKTTVELPIDLVYPLFFCIVVYWMTGLSSTFYKFIVFIIVIIADVLAAQSLGYFVSALVMDVKKAQVILTCLILGSMLVSGYYVNNNNIPDWVGWLRYVSFVQYAFMSLILNEFNGELFECDAKNPTIYSNGSTICPVNDIAVYTARGFNYQLGFGFYFGMLVLVSCVFRLAGYLALRFLHTSHKAKIR